MSSNLSPEESLFQEKRLNHISERMSHFHEHFKSQFNTLHEMADGSYSKQGLSLTMFLNVGNEFIRYLTMHHTLEEKYIFPILAKKMFQFSQEDDGGEHLKSHRQIHDGLDRLDALFKAWKKSPSEYSPTELRECLDSFREVLFCHLNQEVADLRGENLLKYFTAKEIEAIPM